MQAEKYSQNMVVSLSQIMVQQPFFASLLYDQLELVELEDSKAFIGQTKIETAATDGKQIVFNSKFFDRLTEAERLFLICHEICHCMFQHMGRAKNYLDTTFGPDGDKFSPKKWNRAGDYVINDMLISESIGTMPIGGLHNPQITFNDIVDEVYVNLDDDDDDDDDGSGASDGSDGHGGVDQHVMPNEGSNDSDDANMEAAITQAAATAKAQGKLPAALGAMIDNLLDPKVPWQEIVRKEMTLSGSDSQNSWAKPNRRRLVTSNVVMPAKAGSTCGEIMCTIDTSGSISSKEASIFLSEIKAICEDLNPQKLYLLWVDSAVAHVDELESPDEIDAIIDRALSEPLPGGGGTYMPAAFDYAAAWGIEPTTSIIFTDGYTDFGDSQTYPVIWAITESSQVSKPNFGTTVHCAI